MNKLRTIIALAIVVFIPFGMMIWIRVHQSTGFAVTELIGYPLSFGSLSIAAIFLIKRYFLKEHLVDFNAKGDSWVHDITWGFILTLIYFILFFIERQTLSGLLSSNPNMEMLNLMLELREHPVLLLVWFGPVLWIGIALYEELIRTFILTSLWKWSNTVTWAIVVILFSAVIIGLVHWSQGPYGVVNITIKSIVSGIFFYRKRRLFPLVMAHALYDGLQVAVLLITYPDDM